jgi:hypothetical protein
MLHPKFVCEFGCNHKQRGHPRTCLCILHELLRSNELKRLSLAISTSNDTTRVSNGEKGEACSFKQEELEKFIYSTKSDTISGLDGLLVAFFKKLWPQLKGLWKDLDVTSRGGSLIAHRTTSYASVFTYGQIDIDGVYHWSRSRIYFFVVHDLSNLLIL